MRAVRLGFALLTLLTLVSNLLAQQSLTTVPNLIRYGGVVKNAQGAAISSRTVGITFLIYGQQDGGAPVWLETQNVATDAAGQYSVLLGSTTAPGLPSDLFSQQEQRWLAVKAEGQPEQPRVLLVSVPYAFKAHEAETLGGKSLSDFVLSKDSNSTNLDSGVASGVASGSMQTAAEKNINKSPSNLAVSAGATNFSGSTTNQIIGVTQTGTGAGVNVSSVGGIAVLGKANATTGATIAVEGISVSASGTGVRGIETATSGITTGISSSVASLKGTAGVFNNAAGGKILSGQSKGVEKFSVDGSGNVNSTSTYRIGGSSVLSIPGNSNLFLGVGAGSSNVAVSGTANTFSGFDAGVANTTGTYNTFSGFKSGFSNKTGSYNTFSGEQAGYKNNGDRNAFYGSLAGFSNTTGSNNTFLGGEAGYNNNANSNTFSGYLAGFSNTTGGQNTFSGVEAGYNNNADGNTFYGYAAGLANTTGVHNTFSGFEAGYNNNGDSNTFYGYAAGLANTTGVHNTFFGFEAGYSNNGDSNTFYGDTAGYANDTGSYNTFSGNAAGESNSTGSHNTFSGWAAGSSNTTGVENTFIGSTAGQSNTTGNYNEFSGDQAGYNNTTGGSNTFLGVNAGFSNTIGSNNTFVGVNAGFYNVNGADDVYIANPGPGPQSGEASVIRIGDPAHQFTTYMAGIYGSGVAGSPVYVDSRGLLGALASSRRFKEQIRDMGDSTNALMKLRPVTFLYKPEYDKEPRTLQYGLIAEEVAEVYPEMVAYDKEGQLYTVKYQYLTTMLLNEMQKQYHRVDEQADVIKAQQQDVKAQAEVIKTQQQEIDGLKSQLRLQNSAFQERLSRLESMVGTQTQIAAELPHQ
jgi:hypothetical protein